MRPNSRERARFACGLNSCAARVPRKPPPGWIEPPRLWVLSSSSAGLKGDAAIDTVHSFYETRQGDGDVLACRWPAA